MGKKKTLKVNKEKKRTIQEEKNQVAIRDIMAANASLMRSTLLNNPIDDRRDIDNECGYPKEISTSQYKLMYDREGIAFRVVSIYPEESWVNDPVVLENEDPDETEFEKAWEELEGERQLYSYMMKADEISGIGRFGIILLGFDDGMAMDVPVDGINERGEKVGNAERKLLYVRAFSESTVTIKSTEEDISNPRFGKPVMYSVAFEEIVKNRTDTGEITESTGKENLVHWSRVIHIADNRKSSEVYGVPRMQVLFNRLYDLRKICGGSGEMFWKGAFPGYAFQMDPNARALTTTQKTALTDEIASYANGLQRYITLQGIEAKSLEPQVAEPGNHAELQLEMIAITLGVPKRIFMGAEQAKLASVQDTRSWNKRVAKRQNKYISPYILKPLLERLINVGVLPEPVEYTIEWPDLDSPSDFDKAEVLDKQVDAFKKYVQGDVDQLIPPEIFLTMFADLTTDQVEKIMTAAEEREKEMELEEDAEEINQPEIEEEE